MGEVLNQGVWYRLHLMSQQMNQGLAALLHTHNSDREFYNTRMAFSHHTSVSSGRSYYKPSESINSHLHHY